MRGALFVRSWHERLWRGQGHLGDTDDPFGTSSAFFDDFSRDHISEQCAYQPDMNFLYEATRGDEASDTSYTAAARVLSLVPGWDDFYDQPAWNATTYDQPDWSATTCDQPTWSATTCDQPAWSATTCDQPAWSATTCDQLVWSATTYEQPDRNAITHARSLPNSQPVRVALRKTDSVAARFRWDIGLWWLVVMVLCVTPALTEDPDASARTAVPTPTSSPPHLNHAGGNRGIRLIALGLGPKTLLVMLTVVAASAAVCWMVPGFNAGQAARLPPAWGPEMQQTYPFRRWMQDVLLWSVASDLDGSRKAALLIMQLKGGAQELARGYPPQTLIQGGLINGVQADPLTYIIHGLAERFAALGEELRLGSITELLSFSRNNHQHERIDEILVRFDVARQRAHDEGQLTVSITGLTWLLLRAVGVSDVQLLQILTPFGGNFPQTEQELQLLKQQLRRMGHVLENSPGNIASALRGPPKSQRVLH